MNSELTNGLMEVQIGTSRLDAGKNLIVRTSNSGYKNEILYILSGTRVMKEHNNADNDGDLFIGTTKPENQINPVYIAYN